MIAFFRTEIYKMEVLKVDNKRFVSLEKFMDENYLNSEKTVYNWVDSGKAEQRKVFNKSFFRRLK